MYGFWSLLTWMIHPDEGRECQEDWNLHLAQHLCFRDSKWWENRETFREGLYLPGSLNELCLQLCFFFCGDFGGCHSGCWCGCGCDCGGCSDCYLLLFVVVPPVTIVAPQMNWQLAQWLKRQTGCLGCQSYSRWWFKIFFIFTPTWGRFPIWRAYFSDGLKPPTSTAYRDYEKRPWNHLHWWESYLRRGRWSWSVRSRQYLTMPASGGQFFGFSD